jgi:hypothetical protein
MTVCGGYALLQSVMLSAGGGGKVGVQSTPFLFAVGSSAAWTIAKYGIGPLLGMIIYFGSSFSVLIFLWSGGMVGCVSAIHDGQLGILGCLWVHLRIDKCEI